MTDKTNLRAFGLFAIIGVICIIAAACATVKHDLNTMSGAFATCAKADLGQQVTVGTVTGGLEAVVATIAVANTAALEADALLVITQVGVDAFDCAKAAVQTALAAKAGSAVSATPGPSAFDRLDAVSKAYRAAHS